MTQTPTPADLDRLVESWKRHLKATNKSPRTIQTYAEGAGLFTTYARGEASGTGLLDLIRGFIGDQLERHQASTAMVRYHALQQFFKWLVAEEILTVNPMLKTTPPKVPERPVPVLDDAALKALLDTCSGKSFVERRDSAILRVLIDTGSRRAEVAGLRYTPDVEETHDLDLANSLLRVTGKGNRTRYVTVGEKTAQTLDRYIRARTAHPAAAEPWLWLGKRGRFSDTGISQMIPVRGAQAGIQGLHPHQFRHTFAHRWLANGGQEGDLMQLAGWRSRDMLNRYGASAAASRAQDAARRMALGDRI